MKLAIPTNDGLTIASNFRQSRGFLVTTLELGRYTDEEMRWNLLSEMLTSPEGFLYNLTDCDLIFVDSISDQLEMRLTEERKKVVKTDELLITNILLHYRDEDLAHESNLTCCP